MPLVVGRSGGARMGGSGGIVEVLVGARAAAATGAAAVEGGNSKLNSPLLAWKAGTDCMAAPLATQAGAGVCLRSSLGTGGGSSAAAAAAATSSSGLGARPPGP